MQIDQNEPEHKVPNSLLNSNLVKAYKRSIQNIPLLSLLPLAACGGSSNPNNPPLSSDTFTVLKEATGSWQVASNFGAVNIINLATEPSTLQFSAAKSDTPVTVVSAEVSKLQLDSATSLDVAIADRQNDSGFIITGSGDVTFTSAALREGFEDSTSALINVELTGGDLMFDLPSDDNDTLTLLAGSTLTLNGGRLIVDDGTVDASDAVVSGVTSSDGIVLNSKLVLTASQAKELTDAGVSITRGETDDTAETEEISVVEIIIKSAEDTQALEELASGEGERLGLLVAQNARGETPNLTIAVDQAFEEAEENATEVERVFEVIETKKEVIERATGRSESDGTLTLPKRDNNDSTEDSSDTGGGTTSTTPATPSGPTAQEIANSKAEDIGGFDGSNDAPTGQDYEDAGIPGAGDWGEEVTEAVNEAIAGKAGKGSGQGGQLTAEEVRETAKAVEKINEAGDEGKDSPTAEDYENAGVTGVTEGNVGGVNEVVENSRDKGLTPSELQDIVDALNKINAYDGTNVAPTPADYTTVDVAGVTESLLGAMNARVAASDNDNLKPSDLTTLIGEITTASAKINGYTGTDPVPATSDYEALSITGVTADNVAAVNAMIANDATADKTPEELQTLASQAADIIARINAYAGGSERAPSLLDYGDLGITGASTSDDLEVLNAAVAASNDDNLTPAELQTLADAAFTAADKIKAYTGIDSAPEAEDYALLGITGIGAGGVHLATVNGELANTASYTPDVIQTLVNKANTAISKIQGYAGGDVQVPTEADYDALLADDTLVTSGNLDLVNAAIAAKGSTTVDAAGVATIATDAITSAGVINAYAADATNTAPAQSDYDNLGITGVTSADTLAAANAGLADYSSTALTAAQMQGRVNDALQSQSTINLYAGGGVLAPTTTDYSTLGVSGVDNGTVLGYVNAAIAEAQDSSLIPSEMQTIADAAVKINLFDGNNTPPTPNDYLALGVGGVTTATITAVNAALGQSTDPLLTPTEIQAIVAESALTIISVATPSAGGYVTGDTLTFTVNTSNPTTVDTTGGTPRIELTIGSNTEYATFVSGSGSTSLTFSYTVQANDADSDGIEVKSLAANGGTLKDAAGNDLNTTLSAIGDTSGVLLDTQAPTATMTAGQVASASDTITVQSSEVGTAYLVASGQTVTTVAEIEALADNQFNSAAITTANTNTQIAVTGLASGTYKLYVADAAGNLSAATTQTATLDTTAPAAPASLLENGTSTLGNGYWNDGEASATLRVSLPTTGELAVAGDTVELLLDGSSFATAKTQQLTQADISNGYVDFSVAKAEMGSDGGKTFTATITDAAGNTSSASSNLTTNFDATAPTAPTVDNVTADTLTPTITGSATLGAGETLTVVVGGATYESVTVDGNGDWSVNLSTATATNGTLSLTDGQSYDITATVTDAAGNSTADTSTDELDVSLIPQTIDLGEGKGELIRPLEYNDNGTDRLFYLWDPNDTNDDPVEARSPADVRDLGVFGNPISSEVIKVGDIYLQLPDLATFQNVILDGQTNQDVVAETWKNIFYFTGSLNDSESVMFNASINTGGGSRYYAVEIDLFAPATPSLTQNGSELTVTGEAGAAPALFDGSTDITTKFNIIETNGTYVATAKAGEFDGTETLSITAKLTDGFQNESEASSAVTEAIDTTAPPAPTVDVLTADTQTPILTGSAALGEGESLKVLIYGVTYDNVSVDENGDWSIDTANVTPDSGTLNLANTQTYDIRATVTDAAGNASSDTSTDELDIQIIQQVIDLGDGKGNLVEPVVVGSKVYYFWDRNDNEISDSADSGKLKTDYVSTLNANATSLSFNAGGKNYSIPTLSDLEKILSEENLNSSWETNRFFPSRDKNSEYPNYYDSILVNGDGSLAGGIKLDVDELNFIVETIM